MQAFSRPFGDAVRAARIDRGYTQKQLAEIIDVDERTISSIEKYEANTTMEILYPLIRVLKIDPREIFIPELGRESKAHYQLRLLLDNCDEKEATALLSVCETVLLVMRNKGGTVIK
jgi:DNA-binding XRE family transcriptional regulator